MFTKSWHQHFNCQVFLESQALDLHAFLLFLDVYQRITIAQILEDPWFKKGYKPPVFDEKYETSLDDVDAAFGDSEVSQMDENILSLLWYERSE